MHPDALFWHTLDDLRDRAERARVAPFRTRTTADDYNVVMMSALLRKLLLDGQPIADSANVDRRMHIRYPVDGWPIVSGSGAPGSRVHLRGVLQPGDDIPTIPLPPPRDLTKDQMLKEVVLVWNGVEMSAWSLITHIAHVEGGVHVGIPTQGASELLEDLSHRVLYDGYEFALRGLIEVANSVILGLNPLRLAIEADMHATSDRRSC